MSRVRKKKIKHEKEFSHQTSNNVICKLEISNFLSSILHKLQNDSGNEIFGERTCRFQFITPKDIYLF